jgi:CubicO group peptidase (beta-lactamase class C family)
MECEEGPVMIRHHHRVRRPAVTLALAVLAWHGPARAQAPVRTPEAQVDAIFGRWTSATPGCAAGISVDDRIVLERAYGTADLEHDVPNRPDTIFEAGSVSKQFTAAAVLLLAREGKLSLDEPARKYLPEMPDYPTPPTIRQMLQHTSGLRDWGSVEAIAGWPRTSRVYTHAHVLDIVSRQRALNFAPGARWSYSNTGYNLAAILVSRVSGEPFASFTRKRLFEPLGMTRTSWRDDFTRIVKGRAIAYEETGGAFRTEMPFENVHGNGGLLTTVGDLLRWNANFASPRVGDAAFLRDLQTPGRLTGGAAHDYGLGLYVRTYQGLPEVSHSGSTAGYRAFLTRFPEQRLSVAVLCNVSTGQAERYTRAVADIYLGDRRRPTPAPTPVAIPATDLDARAGLYRSTITGGVLVITRDGNGLRADEETPLTPLSPERFSLGTSRTIAFDGSSAHVTASNGVVTAYERVPKAHPAPSDLLELAGEYVSDEAETSFRVVARDGVLELKRRPDTTIRLTPLYEDAFDSEVGLVRFHRDRAGEVETLGITSERVWDLRFARQPSPGGHR